MRTSGIQHSAPSAALALSIGQCAEGKCSDGGGHHSLLRGKFTAMALGDSTADRHQTEKVFFVMKDGVIYRNDRDAGGHGGMRGAAGPAGGGLQHLRGELVTIDTPQSVEF